MDPSSVKHYHTHDCDPKDILSVYISPNTNKKLFDEIVIFPMEVIKKLKMSGDVMLEFSSGPIIFHLLTICENFNTFIVLEASDSIIKELEKWMNREENSLYWSQLSGSFPELESDWETWSAKEEILRKRMKQIIKYNVDKDNPTAPFVLEKADCVLTGYVLQHVSKDKDSFSRNLKKLCSFIKVGGQLLLVGSFNAQYYTVGEHTFHNLTFDEDFVRKAVANAGLTIDYLQVLESTLNADYVKYGNVFCLHAIKQREV